MHGLKEAAQFMALHKFWVALSPATLAPLFLWCVFGIRSVTNFWKIALSAGMGYASAFVFALLWKLFSVPAELDKEKNTRAKNAENEAEKAKFDKQAVEHQSAQLQQELDIFAIKYNGLEADHLASKVELEKLKQPPITFSIATSGWGNPFKFFTRNKGNPAPLTSAHQQ